MLVDFDHSVVSASETCILSVLTMYTDRSMDGLPTCQVWSVMSFHLAPGDAENYAFLCCCL